MGDVVGAFLSRELVEELADPVPEGVKAFSGMEAMLAKLGSDRAEVPGVYRALFEIMGEEAVGARVLRRQGSELRPDRTATLPPRLGARVLAV